MKKSIIVCIIGCTLLSIGTLAFNIVKWSKNKALDVSISKSSNSETDSKTFLVGSTEVKDKYLDFSSVDSFINSYNKYINSIGYVKEIDSCYNSVARSMLDIVKVGNVSISSYQDGGIYEVSILGETIGGRLEEYIYGAEVEILESNSNTYIRNILLISE